MMVYPLGKWRDILIRQAAAKKSRWPANVTAAVLAVIWGFMLIPSLVMARAVPAAVIALPEKENAVLVEKKTQKLYVYRKDPETGNLEQVFETACSTGEVFGPKQQAGDKKTPEGIYFLIDEFEDRYLTPVYGKKAFPTDYPNFLDIRQGKSGYAIWIHGTDKVLKPMDTNGCIALENDDVSMLSNYITLHATPLIIVEEIVNISPEKQQQIRDRVQSFVDNWIQAHIAGNYHEYLSFYSPVYLPDISWWESWVMLRKIPDGSAEDIHIQTSDTGIYQYRDMVLVLMDFWLVGRDARQFLGKRKLFIKNTDFSGLQITGDTFQVREKTLEKSPEPLVDGAFTLHASGGEKPSAHDQVSVLEMVRQWLAAFSAGNMDAYAAFYAPGFYGGGMNKAQWVKRKRQISGTYSDISVTGKDFTVIKHTDGLAIRFLQTSEFSGFSTAGIKQLKLVKKDGLWKISRENWKEK